MTGPRDPLYGALMDLESSAPTDAPPPLQARADRRLLWGLVGAAGVAAVVVGAVIGSSLLDRRGTGNPSPTPSASTSSASSTTPVSSASAEPTDPSASDAPDASGSPEAIVNPQIVMREGADDTLQYVVGLAHGSDGRIAAVNVGEGGEVNPTGPWLGAGAIYIETEDGSWELVDTGATFQDVYLTYLLSPPGRPMVLFGGPADTQVPRGFGGAWTSTDGRTWTEVVVPTSGRGAAIAGGELGYVLAAASFNSAESSMINVWWSEDALNWDHVHSVDAGSGANVSSAGGGPEGFVVAARTDSDAPPLILASGDGRAWFEAPQQPSLTADDVVMTVAPVGPDWVAAGWRALSGPGAGIDLWRSADGLNWDPAGSIEPDEDWRGQGTRAMYPSHLIVRGGMLFLSGALAAEGSDTRPLAVWTSTDGLGWQRLDLGGDAEVRAVDGIECCLWLGGRIGQGTGEAVIWRWDLSAP